MRGMLRGAARGTLQVGDVTVPATFWECDGNTLGAGWLPDTEGIDMTIVAQPGKSATIVLPGRALWIGTILHVNPEHCEVLIDMNTPDAREAP